MQIPQDLLKMIIQYLQSHESDTFTQLPPVKKKVIFSKQKNSVFIMSDESDYSDTDTDGDLDLGIDTETDTETEEEVETSDRTESGESGDENAFSNDTNLHLLFTNEITTEVQSILVQFGCSSELVHLIDSYRLGFVLRSTFIEILPNPSSECYVRAMFYDDGAKVPFVQVRDQEWYQLHGKHASLPKKRFMPIPTFLPQDISTYVSSNVGDATCLLAPTLALCIRRGISNRCMTLELHEKSPTGAGLHVDDILVRVPDCVGKLAATMAIQQPYRPHLASNQRDFFFLGYERFLWQCKYSLG